MNAFFVAAGAMLDTGVIITIMTDTSKLCDRIRGLIYGHCIGSAIGLTTGYGFKKDLSAPPKFPYDEPIRGFAPCDWTDTSDQMIVTMLALTEGLAQPADQIELLLAERLRTWADEGFAELGDQCGMGLNNTMSMIVKHSSFITQPRAVAQEIWIGSNRRLATNSALVRVAALAALPNASAELAVSLTAITHADPRCIAASVLYVLICRGLIHTDDSADDLLLGAVDAAKSQLDNETADREFSAWVEAGYTGPLAALKLDEVCKIGYVFRCLGAALYALHTLKYAQANSVRPSFKKIITAIAAECGDASANCAVAGALLGARLGYGALPADWLAALPNRLWLDEQIDKFLVVLGLSAPPEPISPLEIIALTNTIMNDDAAAPADAAPAVEPTVPPQADPPQADPAPADPAVEPPAEE